MRPILPSPSHVSALWLFASLPLVRAGAAWLVTRPQAWWQGVPVWRSTLEVGAAVLALTGLAAFLLDLQNREEDRINRAWSLIAAAKVEGTGNVGLIEALETLNTRGVSLALLKLPGAYLEGVELRGADLRGADLHGADLTRANLRGADLNGLDLSGAKMIMTDLNDTSLGNAKLGKTDLAFVDLSKVEQLEGIALADDLVFLPATDLQPALFCATVMPDGSSCMRDCDGEKTTALVAMGHPGATDRSCPYLNRRPPGQ